MNRRPSLRRSRSGTLALAAGAAVAAHLLLPALALADRASERTPLDLGDGAEAPPADVGGGSLARVIAGLFVVVAVIYGVTWLLKRMKRIGTPGEGALETVSTVSLAGGGALHLVRVGDEVLLVGAGTHGAATLRGWELAEAIELGLLADPAADDGPGGTDGPTGPAASRRRPPAPPLAEVLRRCLDRLRAWTVRD